MVSIDTKGKNLKLYGYDILRTFECLLVCFGWWLTSWLSNVWHEGANTWLIDLNFYFIGYWTFLYSIG